jgi:CNT family concentrative nucleoside transporter
MAVVMQRVMGASGAESTNVAASIFMGQTEAPITIRPFLEGLTESELFTIMVSGMAHVSGATMAAYVLMAHVEIRHLLTAVIMTAPATIMLAKILVPEVGKPVTAGSVKGGGGKARREHHRRGGARRGRRIASGAEHRGHADRVSRADRDGNGMLGYFHTSLEQILGPCLFSPIAWLLGVKFHDCRTIGNLLGTRLVLNEFVAFQQLGPMKPRSIRIRSPSRLTPCAVLPT